MVSVVIMKIMIFYGYQSSRLNSMVVRNFSIVIYMVDCSKSFNIFFDEFLPSMGLS